MTKRRITLVVDDDRRIRLGLEPVDLAVLDRLGVTVESDEPIPEPDRVQEFRVRIVTKATDTPLSSGEVRQWIQRATRRHVEAFTVTEVEQLQSPSTDVVIHFEDPSDAAWYRNMMRSMLDYGAEIVTNKSEFGFGPLPFRSKPHPEAVIEDLQ
jgi:hypothetical protein